MAKGTFAAMGGSALAPRHGRALIIMSHKDDEKGRGDHAETDEAMLDRAFDRWLNRQLHRLYDPVLAEAVPEEIMRLLEQFETRSGPPPETPGGCEGKN